MSNTPTLNEVEAACPYPDTPRKVAWLDGFGKGLNMAQGIYSPKPSEALAPRVDAAAAPVEEVAQ